MGLPPTLSPAFGEVQDPGQLCEREGHGDASKIPDKVRWRGCCRRDCGSPQQHPHPHPTCGGAHRENLRGGKRVSYSFSPCISIININIRSRWHHSSRHASHHIHITSPPTPSPSPSSCRTWHHRKQQRLELMHYGPTSFVHAGPHVFTSPGEGHDSVVFLNPALLPSPR